MRESLRDKKDDAHVRSTLSQIANSYVVSYKPSKSALKKHGILKKLKNNSDIVIVKPDKGNAVVILDRTSYDECLLKILNDTSKFKVLTEDPTFYREGQLQRRLLKLKKKGFFTDETYRRVYPSGSKPARIYGLPKMHKTYSHLPAFRPIISSIGTFNYNLAKHLGSILKDCVPCEFSCEDTFSFLRELNGLDIKNKFTVSYDVCSLFTNLPLNETLDLAVDLIFEKHKNLKITKNEMRELFVFCTSKTNFLFNGTVYDQIDGCAMGSPIAPILANVFLGYHEKIWLNEYEEKEGGGGGPLFYRRYVDDVFAVFDDEGQATRFLEFLNGKHGNIKFTMEKSENGVLNFLDVKVSNNDLFLTSVYHKPTFTGLLTNFRSFVPVDYKKRLVLTLTDRIYKINNTWNGFHNDIKTLGHYLSRNLFPKQFFERNVKKYLNHKFSGDKKDKEKTSERRYFRLPYLGKKSAIAKIRIMRLFKQFCKPDKGIRLVFNISKVRDYFSTKDLYPNCFKSNVVYLFTCANCGIRYVGRTHTHFDNRIDEHFRCKSSSIFKHLNEPQNSACKNLSNKNNSFKILDNARTDYELALKEGMYIKWYNPALNKQKFHEIITLLI